MLTVKLYRGSDLTLLEAEKVEVTSNSLQPSYRYVHVSRPSGPEIFTVLDWKHFEAEDPLDAYDTAYVENANGRTVEVIRPFYRGCSTSDGLSAPSPNK